MKKWQICLFSNFAVGVLWLARWAIWGDGFDARGAAIHSATHQERSLERGVDIDDAWQPRWGSLEVRAPPTILHGIEWFGGQATNAMLPCDVHSNDGNRAVDIPVCSTQDSERVSGYWLYASYSRWRRLFIKQQQIFPVSVRVKLLRLFWEINSLSLGSQSRNRPFWSSALCVDESIVSSRMHISTIGESSTSSKRRPRYACDSLISLLSTLWCQKVRKWLLIR